MSAWLRTAPAPPCHKLDYECKVTYFTALTAAFFFYYGDKQGELPQPKRDISKKVCPKFRTQHQCAAVVINKVNLFVK